MKFTNKYNLPKAVYDAVTFRHYDRGKSDLTATELISPPQQKHLQIIHDDKIVEDVSERLWALYGQMGHAIIAMGETKSAIKEQRLYYVVEWKGKKIVVGAQFDNIDLRPDKTMDDYKFTSLYAVKNGVKDEWEAQLNILDLLAFHNGHIVQDLWIQAMVRDWNQYEHKKNPKTVPPCPFFPLQVENWQTSRQEAYLMERIDLHMRSRAGEYIPCTDKERWASPRIFKVYRGENKNPSPGGIFREDFNKDAEQQADDFIKGHKYGAEMRVVTVEPEYRRCTGYCNVAKFCPQLKSEAK